VAEDQAVPIVLDTNIVLDLFVFRDPATVLLQDALASGRLRWAATPAMRGELQRVLAYLHIAARLAASGLAAEAVLARFDALARTEPVPAKAAVTCRDPDDQKFIDLAVAHRAMLLSKDRAVLCMRKRLWALGVSVQPALGTSIE
jgi:putative PIN family toxin of toxin-antitoxin system